jgi:hypothetical protein
MVFLLAILITIAVLAAASKTDGTERKTGKFDQQNQYLKVAIDKYDCAIQINNETVSENDDAFTMDFNQWSMINERCRYSWQKIYLLEYQIVDKIHRNWRWDHNWDYDTNSKIMSSFTDKRKSIYLIILFGYKFERIRCMLDLSDIYLETTMREEYYHQILKRVRHTRDYLNNPLTEIANAMARNNVSWPEYFKDPLNIFSSECAMTLNWTYNRNPEVISQLVLQNDAIVAFFNRISKTCFEKDIHFHLKSWLENAKKRAPKDYKCICLHEYFKIFRDGRLLYLLTLSTRPNEMKSYLNRFVKQIDSECKNRTVSQILTKMETELVLKQYDGDQELLKKYFNTHADEILPILLQFRVRSSNDMKKLQKLVKANDGRNLHICLTTFLLANATDHYHLMEFYEFYRYKKWNLKDFVTLSENEQKVVNKDKNYCSDFTSLRSHWRFGLYSGNLMISCDFGKWLSNHDFSFPRDDFLIDSNDSCGNMLRIELDAELNDLVARNDSDVYGFVLVSFLMHKLNASNKSLEKVISVKNRYLDYLIEGLFTLNTTTNITSNQSLDAISINNEFAESFKCGEIYKFYLNQIVARALDIKGISSITHFIDVFDCMSLRVSTCMLLDSMYLAIKDNDQYLRSTEALSVQLIAATIYRLYRDYAIVLRDDICFETSTCDSVNKNLQQYYLYQLEAEKLLKEFQNPQERLKIVLPKIPIVFSSFLRTLVCSATEHGGNRNLVPSLLDYYQTLPETKSIWIIPTLEYLALNGSKCDYSEKELFVELNTLTSYPEFWKINGSRSRKLIIELAYKFFCSGNTYQLYYASAECAYKAILCNQKYAKEEINAFMLENF